MWFLCFFIVFWYYLDCVGLQIEVFLNLLIFVVGFMVIDLEGEKYFVCMLVDLLSFYVEVVCVYDVVLEEGVNFVVFCVVVIVCDVDVVKVIWDLLVYDWDECIFYDFVVLFKVFWGLFFCYCEVFGQVGFGIGGWDSDFLNLMFEILCVNFLGLDDDQQFVVGGVGQMLKCLWGDVFVCMYWFVGMSLVLLNGGVMCGWVCMLECDDVGGDICVMDCWGCCDYYKVVVVIC